MTFKELYYNLKEETITNIRNSADDKRKENAAPVTSHYSTVNKQGTLTFKSSAITTPDKDFWTQKIKPHKKPKQGSSLANFRESYNGDVNVSCDCPDFKYGGYEFIATQNNFKFGKAQMIFPAEKNPTLSGTTCKHLFSCMQVVKFNLPTIRTEFNEL